MLLRQWPPRQPEALSQSSNTEVTSGLWPLQGFLLLSTVLLPGHPTGSAVPLGEPVAVTSSQP